MSPRLENFPCSVCRRPANYMNVEGYKCRAHWVFYPNPEQKSQGWVQGLGGLRKREDLQLKET